MSGQRTGDDRPEKSMNSASSEPKRHWGSLGRTACGDYGPNEGLTEIRARVTCVDCVLARDVPRTSDAKACGRCRGYQSQECALRPCGCTCHLGTVSETPRPAACCGRAERAEAQVTYLRARFGAQPEESFVAFVDRLREEQRRPTATAETTSTVSALIESELLGAAVEIEQLFATRDTNDGKTYCSHCGANEPKTRKRSAAVTEILGKWRHDAECPVAMIRARAKRAARGRA